jgi:hypothetical protein
MLLQGSRSAERPIHAVPGRNDQITVRPVEPRETIAVSRRTYAPISWEHPSLGKSVATGLGGIARTSAVMVVLAMVGVGVAMAIAIVITSIVTGLGFDASAGY